MKTLVWAAFAAASVLATSASAQPQPHAFASEVPADAPFEPHRIAGNLYYVGTKGLAVFLLTTPKGHILISGTFASSVPLIQASVEKLGFHMGDIKLLLSGHAHPDHVSGNALLKQLTGAKVVVMDDDVDVIRSGGRTDFQYSHQELYPPGPVDRIIHDGDKVELGGVSLTAIKTPGHTKGCTAWAFKVHDAGIERNVLIACSLNFNPGYKLVDNAAWPGIAAGFAHSYKVAKAQHPDIWLAPHTFMFGLEQKYARLKLGAETNPYVDPEGYKAFVASRQKDFLAEFARQMEPDAR